MRRCDPGRGFGLAMLVAWASFAGAASAEEIQWQEDPARAWKTAADSNRPMLIYATMDGCLHCKRMEKTTWSDESVRARVNSRFVPIYMPLERHESLVERWRITTFPTTLLVAPNGKVLGRIKGYATADELLRQSQSALAQLPAAEPARAGDGETAIGR